MRYRVTRKLCFTDGAASKSASPGCAALMVHLPAATNVTVFPNTVHTVVGAEVKLTGRSELAVALIVNGGPSGWFDSAPKAIVWLAFVT